MRRSGRCSTSVLATDPFFHGRDDHSLDPKGRLIIPARHRHAFPSGGYLTMYRGGCVAMWTPSEFQQQAQMMKERMRLQGDDLREARAWASNTYPVELDRAGRIAVPASLRTFAELELGSPVVVCGALDHVEIWNVEHYQASVGPTEEAFKSNG